MGSHEVERKIVANQEQLALLKQGVDAWNQWRRENSGIKVDLVEVDLTNVGLVSLDYSVGANPLSISPVGVNLSRANLACSQLIGTNLSHANLHCANLHRANLWGAGLSNANCSRANLRNADLSDTDLREANLRNADFTNADLTNAKLWNADLYSADLRGARLWHTDLNNADLSCADLSSVAFIRTQSLATNFTGATFTGACLEDWNINSETKLDDVICEYVYLKQDEQERRPSSGSFKSGEFTALFQKALETVDLIFADGIDWNAFFQSFQELRKQYSEENLSVQAIEKKSGGAFVIRLEVSADADTVAIEQQAKQLYEGQIRQLEERVAEHRVDIRYLRQSNTKLEGIIQTMAEKENQPTNQTNIYNPSVGAMHTGSGDIKHFTQNIGQNFDDITKLINSLRDSAQTFPEKQREEALVHLEDLQEDLSRPEKQKPQRIKARLAALFAISTTVAGIVAASTDFSNNVLEISNKLGIELIQPHK